MASTFGTTPLRSSKYLSEPEDSWQNASSWSTRASSAIDSGRIRSRLPHSDAWPLALSIGTCSPFLPDLYRRISIASPTRQRRRVSQLLSDTFLYPFSRETTGSRLNHFPRFGSIQQGTSLRISSFPGWSLWPHALVLVDDAFLPGGVVIFLGT